DGKYLITAGWNGMLKSWEVGSGREERSFLGHSGRVRCVAISPDGLRLASGGNSDGIKLWDTMAGPTLYAALGMMQSTGPPSLTFSPDGTMLANRYSGTVQVRYLDADRPSILLDPIAGFEHQPTSVVTDFAFSPDSKTLADAQSRVDQESGKQLHEIRCWNL